MGVNRLRDPQAMSYSEIRHIRQVCETLPRASPCEVRKPRLCGKIGSCRLHREPNSRGDTGRSQCDSAFRDHRRGYHCEFISTTHECNPRPILQSGSLPGNLPRLQPAPRAPDSRYWRCEKHSPQILHRRRRRLRFATRRKRYAGTAQFPALR